MKRRSFLKSVCGVLASFSFPSYLKAQSLFEAGFQQGVKSFKLLAVAKDIALLRGQKTKMLCFEAQEKSLGTKFISPSGSYLGPLLEVRTGDRVEVEFENHLSEPSIVHWHGLDLPPDQDGHPSDVVASGEKYQYNFEVTNRAGLYWYHPHPHGRTGHQVYHGLAGLLVVRDDEEDALDLPSGDNELFLVLQDREFNDENQLVYIQSGHDIMMGKVGDQLMVNGKFERNQEVSQENYRLRLLNGGNALTYRLQWSDGEPIQLLGTDGGLLEEVTDLENILFSPGERLDIYRDFSSVPLDSTVSLLSIPLVENGRSKPFPVYDFQVANMGEKKFPEPKKLSSYEKIPTSDASNYLSPKKFELFPKRGVGWTIDGLEYEMNSVRPKETVKLGMTEVWEFDLTNAGMIHPMHIHGSQFQVVERIHGPYSEGLVFDGGWKDTVAVLPGDRVRVIKRFQIHTGKFLFHCHILEHEDHSMMRNYLIN